MAETLATDQVPEAPPQPVPRRPLRPRPGWRLREAVTPLVGWAVLTAGSMPLVLLFGWMVLASFDEGTSASLLPRAFSLENWSFLDGPLVIDGYRYPSVWTVMANSLGMAAAIAVIEVLVSVTSAYALSRLEVPTGRPLLYSAVLTHAFPPIVGLLASFYLLSFTGLLGTLSGVVLLKVLGNVPMSVWIMKGFFDEVPGDIEWAGALDGASRWSVLRSIVLPTVSPGILAIGIFAFLSGWGEYVMVSVFIFDDALYTFPVILALMLADTATGSYGVVMALATLYMVPVLAFYAVAQRSLMKLVF